jgi:hypothetical protein
MKQNINEIKRMQQLAGIITESQLTEFSNPKIKYLLDLYKEIGDKYPEENILSNDSIMTLEGKVSIGDIEDIFGGVDLFKIDKEELKDYLRDVTPGEQDI